MNIKLLDLNEINLYLCEKNNINFINKKSILKRLKNNEFKNIDEINIILKVDEYFMYNKLYDNIFFWCLKSNVENKKINLNSVFNKFELINFNLIINNDNYLNKFYSI